MLRFLKVNDEAKVQSFKEKSKDLNTYFRISQYFKERLPLRAQSSLPHREGQGGSPSHFIIVSTGRSRAARQLCTVTVRQTMAATMRKAMPHGVWRTGYVETLSYVFSSFFLVFTSSVLLSSYSVNSCISNVCSFLRISLMGNCSFSGGKLAFL